MTTAQDVRVYSSTYQLTYPTVEIELSGKEDNKDIISKILKLQSSKTYKGFDFELCKPLYSEEMGDKAIVSNITFNNCTFTKSFLGSVQFENVRFISCRFEKCDFMNSKLINCVFTKCTFSKCTSWNISFKSTLISAEAFLKGVPFPKDNYKENEITYAEEFRYSKSLLDYSASILNSITEVHNSELIDEAVHQNWKALTDYYLLKIKSKENYKSYVSKRYCKDFIKTLFLLLNLKMTNGGTSLLKLFVILTAIILISPYIFNYINAYISIVNDITGKGSVVTYMEIKNLAYLSKISATLELLMGFGYTAFTPSTLADKLLLALYPILGFFMFALFIPTFLRKVYR